MSRMRELARYAPVVERGIWVQMVGLCGATTFFFSGVKRGAGLDYVADSHMYRDIRALSNGCLDLLGSSGVGLLRYESFLLLLRQSKMYSTQRDCLRRSRAYEETEHWHRDGFVNDTRLSSLRTSAEVCTAVKQAIPKAPHCCLTCSFSQARHCSASHIHQSQLAFIIYLPSLTLLFHGGKLVSAGLFSTRISTAIEKPNMVKSDSHDRASALRVTVTCARRKKDYNMTASIGQMALPRQKDASKCGQKSRKRSDGDRFGSGDAA
jgi:hypothetical protein